MVILNEDDIPMVKNDTHAVFHWANQTVVIQRSYHNPDSWWTITPSPGDFDPEGKTPEECRDVYIKQWLHEQNYSETNKEEELLRLTRVLEYATMREANRLKGVK